MSGLFDQNQTGGQSDGSRYERDQEALLLGWREVIVILFQKINIIPPDQYQMVLHWVRFIYPYTCYHRISFSYTFRFIHVLCVNYWVTGNRIPVKRKFLSSGFCNFSSISERTTGIDKFVSNWFEPFTSGFTYFFGGCYKSVVQKNKFLHFFPFFLGFFLVISLLKYWA